MSLVLERDCAAFFVFDTFILEAPLGLVSVDKEVGWELSLTKSLSGLVLVSVCTVVLELRGSTTNGVEAEGRSSEEDLVPSIDPLETCLDFVASIKSGRLFFLALEMVLDRDGGCDWVEMREVVVEEAMVAALICSDSFCFFFFVAGGGDAELRDNDSGEDDVFALGKGFAAADGCSGADTTDTFLLFFNCGLAVTDSSCVDFSPFAVDSIEAVVSREDTVV